MKSQLHVSIMLNASLRYCIAACKIITLLENIIEMCNVDALVGNSFKKIFK